MGPDELLSAVRVGLKASADPARAAGMQSYMRSTMPFYGVPAPAVHQVCRELFRPLTFPDSTGWAAAVRHLWHAAGFREERYAAIELTGVRAARPFQTPEALRLYEELVVTGAWWDLVDGIATRRLGPILRAYPRPVSRVMRAWSRSDDLWKRRAAIICQVGSKEATDHRLLVDSIEPSIGSHEFFLRKAIGWALRSHARVAPKWVARYVRANEGRLSGLSRREATRHLPGFTGGKGERSGVA